MPPEPRLTHAGIAQAWLATRSCARWCAAQCCAWLRQAARATRQRAAISTHSRPRRACACRQSAQCSPPLASVRLRPRSASPKKCLLTSARARAAPGVFMALYSASLQQLERVRNGKRSLVRYAPVSPQPLLIVVHSLIRRVTCPCRSGQLCGGGLRHRRAAGAAHPARAGGGAQQRRERGADARRRRNGAFRRAARPRGKGPPGGACALSARKTRSCCDRSVCRCR